MTQWTGCGECDCAFPCHNGESRCIRLTPKQEQEPIGWLDGDETLAEFMHRDLKEAHDRCGSATPREFTIPVYLAPPAAQPENGDIRALKYRIHELEGEVLGYKRMLEEAALKKLADLGQEIEQEPVTQWTGCGECDCAFRCFDGAAKCIRLPAQRPWVGLTDAEIKAIAFDTRYTGLVETTRAIEAKLKERNT